MKLKNKLVFLIVLGVKNLRFLSAVSMRLTRLTGKSKLAIHPKHLIKIEDPWYLKYLNKNNVALDLGCGNGQHTLIMAAKVKQVVGLDLRESQIDLANQAKLIAGIKNVQFKVTDIEKKLNYKNDAFDRILFLDVLEHLNDRNLIMREIKRVLKKQGLLLLAIPNRETSWKKLQTGLGINSFTDPDHKVEYSKSEAIAVCEDVGLKVLSVTPVTFDTPLAPIIDLIGGLSLSLYGQLQRWKTNKTVSHPEESIGFHIVAQKN